MGIFGGSQRTVNRGPSFNKIVDTFPARDVSSFVVSIFVESFFGRIWVEHVPKKSQPRGSQKGQPQTNSHTS